MEHQVWQYPRKKSRQCDIRQAETPVTQLTRHASTPTFKSMTGQLLAPAAATCIGHQHRPPGQHQFLLPMSPFRTCAHCHGRGPSPSSGPTPLLRIFTKDSFASSKFLHKLRAWALLCHIRRIASLHLALVGILECPIT